MQTQNPRLQERTSPPADREDTALAVWGQYYRPGCRPQADDELLAGGSCPSLGSAKSTMWATQAPGQVIGSMIHHQRPDGRLLTCWTWASSS